MMLGHMNRVHYEHKHQQQEYYIENLEIVGEGRWKDYSCAFAVCTFCFHGSSEMSFADHTKQKHILC